MIWIRLIIIIIALLAAIYYSILILHCFGVVKITNRKLSFGRMIVPFYYWIVSFNENTINKK